MAILVLEYALPFLVSIIAFVPLTLYRKVKYPKRMVFGCMIPKVCVVLYEDVVAHNSGDNKERSLSRKRRRAVRRQDFIVNWGYLSQQALNTKLFLQAVRFEKSKIDERKPGLKYNDREVLVEQLVEELTELRWKQVRWQLQFVARAKFGLHVDKQIFIELVDLYKELEENIVGLAGMYENCYQEMLMDRLGLTWGSVEGGGAA